MKVHFNVSTKTFETTILNYLYSEWNNFWKVQIGNLFFLESYLHNPLSKYLYMWLIKVQTSV